MIGEFAKDSNGNLLIDKDRHGKLTDSLGRRVNNRGYLIDRQGNIITKDNQKALSKSQLDEDGDIPIEMFKKLFVPKSNMFAG